MIDKEILENHYLIEKLPAKIIAEIYNVSAVSIANWLKKYEIPIRSKSDIQKDSKNKFRVSIDLTGYLEGETIQNIATKHGVSTTRIHKEINKLGIHQIRSGNSDFYKSKKVNRTSFELNDDMINDYYLGMSILDLCKKYSISRSIMTDRLYESNVIMRTKKQSQKLALEKGYNTKLEEYGYKYFPEYKKSKGELELLDSLNNLGFNFKTSRSILDNHLELDGYDEENNIAFEYCGLYWHSEKIKNDKNYHYKKYIECLNKGIKLYTIFEDEWEINKVKVLNYIVQNSKKNSNVIYARKTKFKQIEKHIASNFIEKIHMQGKPNSIDYSFGLFKDDKLLSIMTFAKHHRNNNSVVMNRYCGINDLVIIGGASKLIKNSHDIINQDIITWSDNRWSNGNVYEKMGCELDGELPPDYYWTNFKKRMSKQSRKKSATKQPLELTEKEYNESLGYSRIWDCGKKRWIYK